MSFLRCIKCNSEVEIVTFEVSEIYICALCGEVDRKILICDDETPKLNTLASQKERVPPNISKKETESIGHIFDKDIESSTLDKMAEELFFKSSLAAAEKGDVSAQYDVGCCYYYGKGTLKLPGIAEYWLSLAANSGCLDARSLLKQVCTKPVRGEQEIAEPVSAKQNEQEDKEVLWPNLWEIFKKQSRRASRIADESNHNPNENFKKPEVLKEKTHNPPPLASKTQLACSLEDSERFPLETQKLNINISFEEMKALPEPWKSFNSSDWERWKKKIRRENYSLEISTLSTRLCLEWPSEKKSKVVSHYLRWSFDELHTIINQKKRKFIFLSIAYLSQIKDSLIVEDSSSSEQGASEPKPNKRGPTNSIVDDILNFPL